MTTLPDTPLLRKAVLDRTAVDHYEGQGATPITTRVNYTIDGEGRTSGEYNEGRIDLTGDEKRSERTFASDDVLWVRDLVAEDKLLAGDGTLLSWQRMYYGDNTGEQPLGAAGRGWLRRSEVYSRARPAGSRKRSVATTRSATQRSSSTPACSTPSRTTRSSSTRSRSRS